MINEDVREYLREVAPDAVLFDEPSFDNSIIGLSQDGGVIYDYDKMIMIDEFILENVGDDVEDKYAEAADYIDYNTLRVIPYTSRDGIAPTILFLVDT